LYEEQFDADRTEMIERAINTGVSKMIIPNVDSTTIKGMMDLVQQFPESIFPMMGLHPCYVKPETYKQELEIVKNIFVYIEISLTISQSHDLKLNLLPLVKLASICIGTNLL
jgi:Tat protein secretion system quality control protein TatD with DNase activity